ncbi:Zn-ribbon domain-containing OB-fold protein [Chloroflexota bacterium]
MNETAEKREQVPALPDLFMWTDEGVHLMSARCNSCGTVFFPKYHEQHRPGCSREGIESILLNGEGILASYTVQHYMPPAPFRVDEKIAPYIIGLVEFPEGIQVAGLMIDCSPEQLEMGMRIETNLFTMYQNDDNQDVVTWAFRPVGAD